jgi:hypothetical protein
MFTQRSLARASLPFALISTLTASTFATEVMGPSPSPDNPPSTLFQNSPELGGFGGPSWAYTRLNHEPGVLLGGEGALLLDHRVSLGAAGYAWAGDSSGTTDSDGGARSLQMAYGGLTLRYSFLRTSPVYATVGTLVGSGALALTRDETSKGHPFVQPKDIDPFFVVEPQVSLQVNVFRWMRAGLQGGYRMTAGVSKLGYTASDVNGLTLGGTLQFGWL